LELMQELRIPKGVYTSTLDVNSDTHGLLADESYRYSGRHLSEYDRTKAEAHRIAEQFIARGLPLVIVMPGLVYGPGDTSSARSTLVSYLQRRLPMIPRKTAFSWAHVEDIALAHRLAMEKGRPGETYIVCGPTHTLIEALQLANTLTGIPLPRSAPPLLLKAMSVLMGALERVLPLPALYTAEGLRVIAGITYIGDNAKARRELGYSPRPLEAGLRETLEHEMRLLGMKA
jgi:nucleoside-diphosphate-sugar epimerase